MSERFQLDLQKEERVFQGKPIWLNKEEFPNRQTSRCTVFAKPVLSEYTVACFRKRLIRDTKIKKIVVFLTADARYRFWFNQRLKGMGPTITGGDYGNREPMEHWYYDRYEIEVNQKEAEFLAEVRKDPVVMAEYSMGQGMFLADLELYFEDGRTEIVGTDSDWECALNQKQTGDGTFDGRNSLKWGRSEVIENRWNLIEKPIPHLDYQEKRPISCINPFYEKRVRETEGKFRILAGAPVTFWLKFDKNYAGYFSIKAKGNEGAVLRIGSQEILGRTDREEQMILGKQELDYLGFKLQSVHYLQVVASAIWEDLELEVGILTSEYPVSKEGTFRCNDDGLNQIYEVGKWTLRICRQDYHLDSPIHQETLGCTGDYMIESLINYMTFGDPYLTRLDLQRTAAWLKKNQYRMFHTSYSLMWIQMLVDYYRHTADSTLFETCREEVEGLLELFDSYIGESGLIEYAPNYMFMDWVQVGEINLHHPPRITGMGYLTALYARALQDGIFIMEFLEKKEKAELYRQRLEQVKRSFRILWDEKRQIYKDGIALESKACQEWMPDSDTETWSQHTNAMAVLYGLAEEGKERQIMEKVMEDQSLIQAQPYFCHFLFEALERVGLFETYGNALMQRWNGLLSECDVSLKEVWNGFDCDYSHAWGATPVYQLMTKVLGVKVLEPGFRKVRIRPQLGDLEYAEGTIPTPYGYLKVSAKKEDGTIRLEVSGPDEVEIETSCRD